MSTPHRMMHVLPITTHSDGLFEFTLDGELAIVAQVHDSEGDLADLVGWQPERPGHWWLRFADVAVLGGQNLELAGWYGEPIHLHGTPQDFFRARQRGCCVLLWSAPLADLFAGVRAVTCDSEALADRLTASLRAWEPTIAMEVRHAA